MTIFSPYQETGKVNDPVSRLFRGTSYFTKILKIFLPFILAEQYLTSLIGFSKSTIIFPLPALEGVRRREPVTGRKMVRTYRSRNRHAKNRFLFFTLEVFFGFFQFLLDPGLYFWEEPVFDFFLQFSLYFRGFLPDHSPDLLPLFICFSPISPFI